MTPLLIVKLNGAHSLEARASFMAAASEGIEKGALVLSDECDVLAFDETGRMVYPVGRKEALRHG